MAINNYAESWTDTYDKYKSIINFVAGDFDTLKDAIRRYIVLQNPENYNDWAESSEVGMFANGLSYLGETLHYRVDLNAHDIFPSTTERRQSLLNFVKMLSYSPKRNICANGIAKLTQIQTTQTVYDTAGNLLKDVPIIWNDSSNKNWLEQFLTVMNSTFVSTNPYGKPMKKEVVNGITTQIYEMNNVSNSNAAYSFTASVNGSTQQFEVVNADINADLKSIFERAPMPEQAFHLLYRNDGTGNASKNTGFFVFWKQGSLKSEYHNFDQKIENNSYPITTKNINEYDVWVQEVDGDTGLTKSTWTQIANDEYLVYNNTDTTIRNIYKAETREDDTVIIRFSDGKFGTIPVGIFRFWYRVSQGNANLYIKPADIKNVSIRIPYKSNNTTDDNVYYLTLTFTVEDISHIRQSVMQESLEYIRVRSPQVYSTQNRMVTGQDYNYFPKSLGQQVRIVKAIERTYAGNSRYIKFNDPTGTYQDLNMLAEDGYIYQDEYLYNNDIVDDGTQSQTIIDNYILPLLNSSKFENYYYKNWEARPLKYNLDGQLVNVRWSERYSTGNNTSYGQLRDERKSIIPFSYLRDTMRLSTGSFVKFSNETSDVWAKIISMEQTNVNDDLDYLICIDTVLENNFNDETNQYNWLLVCGYYPLKTSINSIVNSTLRNKLDNKQTFGLAYKANTATWSIIDAEDLTPEDEDFNQNDWVIKVTYNSPNTWNFKARQLDYVFGSAGKVSFFFNMDEKLNNTDGFYTRDYIKVLQLNSTNDDKQFTQDFYWKPSEVITYADGYTNPHEVKVYGYDSDKNASIDNPVQFKEMVGSSEKQLYFFTNDSSDIADYQPVMEVDSMWDENNCYTTKSGLYHCKKACKIYPAGTVLPKDVIVTHRVKTSSGYYIDDATPTHPRTFNQGEIAVYEGKKIDLVDEGYNEETGEADNNPMLISWDANTKTARVFHEDEYYTRSGMSDLKFIWQHYASMNYIIDPCPTNIIDIYALTNTYYQAVQNWLLNGKKGTFPKLQSAYEMKSMFAEIEKYKMVSDSIVWHPIKYKLLFGNEAGSEYRAKFSVIKSETSTLSDNEIKQRIVEAIDTYFASMEAGEKFFFTQLSTYIHEVLGTNIGTIVIVPQYSDNKFGNLFEISCDSDEILLSSASLDDITIISKITNNNIRIGN